MTAKYLRSRQAYWDMTKPGVIDLLNTPLELLTQSGAQLLIEELDRRFMQLWDKIGYEKEKSNG